MYSSLLTIGGEWWPSAKNGQLSFGSAADLTFRMLYMDSVPNKHPCLDIQNGTGGLDRGEQAPRTWTCASTSPVYARARYVLMARDMSTGGLGLKYVGCAVSLERI